MKRNLTLLLVLICILATIRIAYAADIPRRNSTEVSDAFKSYTPDKWIISEDEESLGDQDAQNAVETDIDGVMSCYDDDYLRFDIILVNPISFKWATWYAVKLEYEGMNEYYKYYTDTNKLIYEKEQNGKIVKTETLSMADTKDFAGVTEDNDNNDDVYFVINKAKHIGGEKGKRYFLTCTFLSGYLTAKNDLHVSDDTMVVDVEFKY
jgi:hypothetical protein